MVRTEGPCSLYNGLVAGLQHQMSFASIRIGLYDSVKQFYTPKGSDRECRGGVGAEAESRLRVRRPGQCDLGRAGSGELVTDAQETEPPSRKLQSPGPGKVGTGQGRPPEISIRPTGVLGGRTLAHSLSSSPDSSIATRILAGCTTGAMAVTCAQPTDVVKVRFQASVHGGSRSNRKYSGTMDAYRTIAREEGVRGLWKGRSGLQVHRAFGRDFPTLGLGQETEQGGELPACGSQ